MGKPTLKIQKRVVAGKKVRALRREGTLPAVLYGHNLAPVNIALSQKEFDKVFDEAGQNTIILLKDEEGKTSNVLVHDLQSDGVTGNPIHVDFYKVKMDEKITTKIPLHFIGESRAVREMDGTLVTNRTDVEVECLPGDLIPEIEVDITPLEDFEANIHISDLRVPETIKILDEPEETVATVEPPRSEEELAELEEAVEEPEMPGAEEIAEGEAPTEGEGEEKTE